jgi:hypothetical protein
MQVYSRLFRRELLRNNTPSYDKMITKWRTCVWSLEDNLPARSPLGLAICDIGKGNRSSKSDGHLCFRQALFQYSLHISS